MSATMPINLSLLHLGDIFTRDVISLDRISFLLRERARNGPLRLTIILDIHEQSQLNVIDVPDDFLSEIKLAENTFHRWLAWCQSTGLSMACKWKKERIMISP